MLGQVFTLRNHGSLLPIQPHISVWNDRPVMVLQGRHEGDLFCSLDSSDHFCWIKSRLLHVRAPKVNISPESAFDCLSVAFRVWGHIKYLILTNMRHIYHFMTTRPILRCCNNLVNDFFDLLMIRRNLFLSVIVKIRWNAIRILFII